MKRFSYLVAFAIALGNAEATAVVYRRAVRLYVETDYLFSAEQTREIATIIILAMFAISAGKNFLQRFAYFSCSFGVWDISYYVWFKNIIDWPPSLLTPDVLFTIPTIWIAPVLAPVICSLVMIFFGISLLYLQEKRGLPRIKQREWGMLFAGAAIIFISFVWNYLSGDIQADYNWLVFSLGIAFPLGAIFSLWRG